MSTPFWRWLKRDDLIHLEVNDGVSSTALRGIVERGRRLATAGNRRPSTPGLASMLAVTFLQTGILKHLPDPPISGFDSDAVDLSGTAFLFGIPDGSLAAVSFAANLPLARPGGPRRSETQPWLPLLVRAKAAMDAVVSGWYVVQMSSKEHAWCGYCVTGSLSSLAILALTLPEACEACGVGKRSCQSSPARDGLVERRLILRSEPHALHLPRALVETR